MMKKILAFGEINKLQDIFGKYLSNNSGLLPRIIHVETRSKCNSTCGFCPASVGNDTRQDVYMPDELITKILNELAKADYSNRLSFYNNNEPFLDKRIFDIIKQSRSMLPKAYLELKSNGIILNSEMIFKVFNCGLDMLYITYYSRDGKFSDNLQAIRRDLAAGRRFKGHFEEGRYYTRVMVTLRYTNKIVGSRAGNSPNKNKITRPLDRPCFRPFEMMTISPQGYVSTCSEDFYYNIRMGDIQKQSFLEIWRSPEWYNLRKNLLAGKRLLNTNCAKCDYKGFTYEMLKENGLSKAILWLKLKNSLKKIILICLNKVQQRH